MQTAGTSGAGGTSIRKQLAHPKRMKVKERSVTTTFVGKKESASARKNFRLAPTTKSATAIQETKKKRKKKEEEKERGRNQKPKSIPKKKTLPLHSTR